MRTELAPGLKHSRTIVVDSRMTAHTVSLVFGIDDLPPVLATANMIVFMELTCAEAVRPFMDEGEQTVGIHVDMSHLAATLVGMRVTAEVELIEIRERRLRFKVRCRDEKDIIGEGFHERGVINRAKFMSKLAAKSA